MSFSSLPPETLVHIFAFEKDIATKVRLQRVNKQWRDCLRDPQSWTRNTQLNIECGKWTTDRNVWHMLQYLNPGVYASRYSGGPEAQMALLQYAPKITSLDLCGTTREFSFDASFLRKLWENLHKIRITSLRVSALQTFVPCKPEYQEMLMRLVNASRPSLTKIEHRCCTIDECPVRKSIAKLIRSCPALRELQWEYLPYGAFRNVANTLKYSTVESLQLIMEGCDGKKLAKLLNSAKSIRKFEIPDYYSLKLKDFIENLSPSAAAMIEILKLDSGYDMFDVLAVFPTVFPNLRNVEVCYTMGDHYVVYCNTGDKVKSAKAAKVVQEFISNGRDRQVPLTLKLTIMATCEYAFSKRFRAAIDKSSAALIGPQLKRRPGKWNRTLQDGAIKVLIEHTV